MVVFYGLAQHECTHVSVCFYYMYAQKDRQARNLRKRTLIKLHTPMRSRENHINQTLHFGPSYLSHSVHTRPSRQLLVLIPQPRDLQECVDTIALEVVQLQVSGPILRVDPAQRQAEA